MKAILEGHYGSDLDVVNAARVSFDKKSDWIYDWADASTYTKKIVGLSDKDARLINYLARGMRQSEWNHFITSFQFSNYEAIERKVNEIRHTSTHWVPFTHNYIKLRMTAPVPIRTQCFKSKFGFTESEESRRYISSTPTLFIPEFREKAEDVKQGSGKVHKDNDLWQRVYESTAENAIAVYEKLLINGISEEQARFILPQGVEVNWIWSGNLASYARYYNLRSDDHAQKESQDLAEMVRNIIEPLFPVSWKALTRIK